MSKPEYLTKQLAADTLGISPRRLLEISLSGAIKRKYTRNPATKRRMAIFRSADVLRIAEEIQSRKSAVRPEPPPRSESAALVAHSGTPHPDQPHEARWLTLDEAAAYTGLPASFLGDRIEQGKLPALNVGKRPGGRWRVSRRDLDQIAGDTQV